MAKIRHFCFSLSSISFCANSLYQYKPYSSGRVEASNLGNSDLMEAEYDLPEVAALSAERNRDVNEEIPSPGNHPEETSTLHDTPNESKLTFQTRASQTEPGPELNVCDIPKVPSESSENIEEFEQETEDLENCNDDDEVEKEIEHFPKIVNNPTESDSESEFSLHVPKVTITERIHNLSSTSKVSLKFWQNRENTELRGQLNATRLHPKCFSQLHLENVSRRLTSGGYEQGNTTTPAGVKTLIFWSHDRRRPIDKTTLESTSGVWASRLNMHTRSGKPVTNLQSVHGNSHKTPKRTKSETCRCLRYIDHHGNCPRTHHQEARTPNYQGKRFFQTEIREDDGNGADSFIRKLAILNANSEAELNIFPRHNSPVGHVQQSHPTNFWGERSGPFNGYKLGKIHSHLIKSMDSIHSHPTNRGHLPNPASAPLSLSRHPHVPSILSQRPRGSNPHEKNFDGVIRGANNFL